MNLLSQEGNVGAQPKIYSTGYQKILVKYFRKSLCAKTSLTSTTNSSWVSSSLRSPTCKLILYGGAKGSKALPLFLCVEIPALSVTSV